MSQVLRRIASLAAVVLVALATAACGGGDDEGTGESTKAASGRITVWGMGAEGDKLDVIAKDFMRENPGITVKVTPVAWEVAHDKLITAIAGNKTPDVSQVGTTWMGEFAKTGALEEVPDSINLADTFKGAHDTAIVDGTTYGVPWYVETRVLYYRTDIAKKAGITKPPTNWEELKAAAKAMKEKGGAKYGIALSPDNWQEFMPFVWQNGADVIDGDKFTFTSPKVVEALDYYKSFFTEKLTAPSVPEGFAIEQGFVAGTHPMFFSGPWHIGLIEDTGGAKIKGKWDIALMPKEEAGTSFVGGSDLAVFKGAKNKDAAWKFVQYLMRPKVQQKWYQVVSDLPSVKSAWNQGKLASDPKLKLFGQQLDDAKSPPPIPKWEQVAAEAIGTSLEKATTGGEPAAKAAKEMQQKAQSIGTG